MAYNYVSEQAFSDPKDVALLHSLANWVISRFSMTFLEDGKMFRRHSNEGEVIEEVIIILFLDVCKCNFFSLCI